jgi:hypothetical protein
MTQSLQLEVTYGHGLLSCVAKNFLPIVWRMLRFKPSTQSSGLRQDSIPQLTIEPLDCATDRFAVSNCQTGAAAALARSRKQRTAAEFHLLDVHGALLMPFGHLPQNDH